MSDLRKHSDDLLRDKFLSFEGDIPMSDWEIIAQKLERKKRPLWIWWAAVPLLLVSILFVLSYYRGGLTTQPGTTNNKDHKHGQTEKRSTQTGNTVPGAPEVASGEIADKPERTERRQSNGPSNLVNKEIPPYAPADPVIEKQAGPAAPFFEWTGIAFKTLEGIPYTAHKQPEMVVFTLNRPVKIKPDKPKFRPEIEIGINLAPNFGLDKIKTANSKMVHKSYFNSIAGSSGFGSGFNNGLNIQVNLKSGWYLRTGIYSSDYSVFHAYNYLITEVPRVNAQNEITDDPYTPIPAIHIQHSGKSTLKFVSVPVQLGNRWLFGQHTGIETRLGVNLSHLTKATGQVANPTFLHLEEINSKNSIKNWNTAVQVSTGVFYKTKNSLIFTVEPNFATLISSATQKEHPVKTRYYNYGINLNVNYILKDRNP